MVNQLISFETAKIAKEKGFEDLCFYYYDSQETLNEPFLENGSSTDVEYRVGLTDLLENHNRSHWSTFSAPTQSELQKWLREKHNIIVLVDIFPTPQNYQEFKYSVSNNILPCGITTDLYDTYEEALEIGLQEALKLI